MDQHGAAVSSFVLLPDREALSPSVVQVKELHSDLFTDFWKDIHTLAVLPPSYIDGRLKALVQVARRQYLAEHHIGNAMH